MGFLGNTGQHLLFYDLVTLRGDRVSTLRFEIPNTAIKGSTHLVWLDETAFLTSIGEHLWRFDWTELPGTWLTAWSAPYGPQDVRQSGRTGSDGAWKVLVIVVLEERAPLGGHRDDCSLETRHLFTPLVVMNSGCECASPVAGLGVGLLVSDVALPVPSSVVMVAQGAVFGLVVGALLALLGGVGATMTAYLLGRRGRRRSTAWSNPRSNSGLRSWWAGTGSGRWSSLGRCRCWRRR